MTPTSLRLGRRRTIGVVVLLVVIGAACADTATTAPSTTQVPRSESRDAGDTPAAPSGSDESGEEEGGAVGGAPISADTPHEPVDAAGLAEAVAAANGLAGLLSVPDRWDVCGVHPDGSVACSGEFGSEGPFSAISVGVVGDGCGLRLTGALECWDDRLEPSESDDPPEGMFAAVGVGVSRSCGLRPDGRVECWRYSGSGRRHELLEGEYEVPYPGGVFSAVSVGYHHVCGLRPEGLVACWGEDWFGQSDPPAGQFLAVDAGVSHSCGLRSDGSVACWGEDSMDSGLLGRDDEYRGFHYFDHESGERAYVEEQIEQFGDLETPEAPVRFMTAVDVVRDADLLAAMVERAAGWEPPPGPYKALSAGGGFTCGLRLDGEVSCWGYVNNSEPRIPLAVYAEVAGDSVRARHADRHAESEDTWLLHAYSRMLAYVDLVNPPPGPFVAVDAGDVRACGLHADGEISCWGYGPARSPPRRRVRSRPRRSPPTPSPLRRTPLQPSRTPAMRGALAGRSSTVRARSSTSWSCRCSSVPRGCRSRGARAAGLRVGRCGPSPGRTWTTRRRSRRIRRCEYRRGAPHGRWTARTSGSWRRWRCRR